MIELVCYSLPKLHSYQLIQWLVDEGEKIYAGKPLFEYECESFRGEYHSPHAGTLSKKLLRVEDFIASGTRIALLQEPKAHTLHTPQLDSSTTCTLSKWFLNPGTIAHQGEPLCELETDKVIVEIPAPYNGTLHKHLASSGTTLKPQDPYAIWHEHALAPDEVPNTHQICAPYLGEVGSLRLTEWFVGPGDLIDQHQELAELAWDQHRFIVHSPHSGSLLKRLVLCGEHVDENQPIATLQPHPPS